MFKLYQRRSAIAITAAVMVGIAASTVFPGAVRTIQTVTARAAAPGGDGTQNPFLAAPCVSPP